MVELSGATIAPTILQDQPTHTLKWTWKIAARQSAGWPGMAIIERRPPSTSQLILRQVSAPPKMLDFCGQPLQYCENQTKWDGATSEGNNVMSIEHDLQSILVKWKKDDALPLIASTKLSDLNIDSLDLVEVMFEIEEKFDVSLMQSHQEAREASFADLTSWVDQQLVLQRNRTTAGKPAITLREGGTQPH
jgi:acyl carrier protein